MFYLKKRKEKIGGKKLLVPARYNFTELLFEQHETFTLEFIDVEMRCNIDCSYFFFLTCAKIKYI